MTEAEFITSANPAAMLAFVSEPAHHTRPGDVPPLPASDRKLRLWVAACRARWPHLAGATDLDNRTRLQQAVRQWMNTSGAAPAREIADLLRCVSGNPFRPVSVSTNWRPEMPARIENGWVVGTPYLTPEVLSIARACYDERGRECGRCKGFGFLGHPAPGQHGYIGAPDCPDCNGTGRIDDGTLDDARLAVLSDALEEAGCDDMEILSHLRSPGPHVRGCHVIDLVLGEE